MKARRYVYVFSRGQQLLFEFQFSFLSFLTEAVTNLQQNVTSWSPLRFLRMDYSKRRQWLTTWKLSLQSFCGKYCTIKDGTPKIVQYRSKLLLSREKRDLSCRKQELSCEKFLFSRECTACTTSLLTGLFAGRIVACGESPWANMCCIVDFFRWDKHRRRATGVQYFLALSVQFWFYMYWSTWSAFVLSVRPMKLHPGYLHRRSHAHV